MGPSYFLLKLKRSFISSWQGAEARVFWTLLDWMKKWELPEEICRASAVRGRLPGEAQRLGADEEDEGVAEGREDDQGRDEAPVVVVAEVEADGCLDVRDDVGREDEHVEEEELADQEAVLSQWVSPERCPIDFSLAFAVYRVENKIVSSLASKIVVC